MDSSPDLSLKLRRGSSDSRDSFYMDFAQGIDSDIEEVTTTDAPTSSRQANNNSSVEVIDECVGGGDIENDVEKEDCDISIQTLPPPPPTPPMSLAPNKRYIHFYTLFFF